MGYNPDCVKLLIVCNCVNLEFVCFVGEGTAGKGHLWDVRPLCEGDAPAGQEASPGDQDQETHTESALERDILLRRSVLFVWARALWYCMSPEIHKVFIMRTSLAATPG